jgi:hypothetical protein
MLLGVVALVACKAAESQFGASILLTYLMQVHVACSHRQVRFGRLRLESKPKNFNSVQLGDVLNGRLAWWTGLRNRSNTRAEISCFCQVNRQVSLHTHRTPQVNFFFGLKWIDALRERLAQPNIS